MFGVLEEEIEVWNSQGGGKDKHLFFLFVVFWLYIPQYQSHKTFFSLSPELMLTQQTTQFKLCTKDYVTTMYPA